jgi:predicted XRE-type DNA-binding protein
MKRVVRKPTKTSVAPPKGWPSEEVLSEAEKHMNRGLASKLLSEEASPVERIKHELCVYFIRYCRDEKITQRELAKRLDVTESRVSEILHYHHEQYSIDRLLELLYRVSHKVTVKVTVKIAA